jgi:hypothetical protein
MSEKGKRSGSSLIFTRETIELIVKLYTKDLYDLRKLKKMFDCSSSTVNNYLVREGIVVRTRTETQALTKWSKEKIKSYYAEYLEGNPLHKLAEVYKISARQLRKEFIKLDLKILSRTDWNSKFGIPYSGDNHPLRKKALEKLHSGTVRLVTKEYFTSTTHYISKRIVMNYPDRIKITDKAKLTIDIHLDHKYSVHDAFYNPKNLKRPITMQELCHPCNLVYKTAKSNMTKNFRSNIPLYKLRKRIRKFNLTFGDPFKQGIFTKIDFNSLNTLGPFSVPQRTSHFAKAGLR